MTGIEEARTYLPWWVVWGPLVVRLPILFVMSLLIASLAAIVTGWPIKKAKDQSWVNRARLAYPVRMITGRINLLLLLMPALILNYFSGQLCPVSNDLLTLLTGITCYCGCVIPFFFAERKIRLDCFTFVGFLRKLLFYWLIFGSSLLVFLCLIPFMPQTFNDTALVLFVTATGLLLFFSVGGGIYVARILGLVRPAPRRLREIVEKVSVSMGIHVRASYVIHAPVTQAIAWPFLRCVAFTSRALELFDDDELAAVCAHEAAHLSESRLMYAGRISFLVVLIPLVAVDPLVHAVGLLPVLSFFLVGIVLAGRYSSRLSQHLENRADQLAVQYHVPGIFARALEKFHEANLTPAVEPGEGLSHPHLYDRLVAAGITPEYARPAPPSLGRVRLAFGCSLLVMFGLWIVMCIGHRSEERSFNLIVAAISNGSENDLSTLAMSAWTNHQIEESAAFYRAASETNLTRVDLPANTALTLANLDRLEEAELFAHEAERRLAAGGIGTQQVIDNAWEAIKRFKELKQVPQQRRPRRPGLFVLQESFRAVSRCSTTAILLSTSRFSVLPTFPFQSEPA